MIPGQPHGQWPQQQPQVLPEEQYDMRTGEDPPGAVPVSAMPITIDLSTEADDD